MLPWSSKSKKKYSEYAKMRNLSFIRDGVDIVQSVKTCLAERFLTRFTVRDERGDGVLIQPSGDSHLQRRPSARIAEIGFGEKDVSVTLNLTSGDSLVYTDSFIFQDKTPASSLYTFVRDAVESSTRITSPYFSEGDYASCVSEIVPVVCSIMDKNVDEERGEELKLTGYGVDRIEDTVEISRIPSESGDSLFPGERFLSFSFTRNPASGSALTVIKQGRSRSKKEISFYSSNGVNTLLFAWWVLFDSGIRSDIRSELLVSGDYEKEEEA